MSSLIIFIIDFWTRDSIKKDSGKSKEKGGKKQQKIRIKRSYKASFSGKGA